MFRLSPPRESVDRIFNPREFVSFFFPFSKDRKIIFNETENVSKVMDSCNIHVHNVIKLVTGRSRNFKIFE